MMMMSPRGNTPSMRELEPTTDGSSPVSYHSLPRSGVSVRLGATTTLVDAERELEPNYFRHEIAVTMDWVESTYYIITPAGDELETYVLGTRELTIAYHPATGVQQLSNFFADLGTALYGSTPTPYDDIRALEIASRGSQLPRWEELASGARTVRFSKPGSAQTVTMRFTPHGHLESSVVSDEHDRTIVARTFSDYRKVGDGWYPYEVVIATTSHTTSPSIRTEINTLSATPLSDEAYLSPPARPVFGSNVRTVALGNQVNPTPPALGPGDRPLESATQQPTAPPPKPTPPTNDALIALGVSAVVAVVGVFLWVRGRSRTS
jgi:hypothetical protein